jgi:hypothetical protein
MTVLVRPDQISFPVYLIGRTPPISEDGVLFNIQGHDTKYSDASYRIRVLDDKKLPGKTLASRRLQLLNMGERLIKLSKAIFFLSDFIKLAKRNIWFIDSEGLLFTYSKTKRVPLIFEKVTKVIPMPQGGAVIEIDNVPGRYKVLFTPRNKDLYAGVLIDGMSYIFYGLYDKKYSKTTRAI